MISKSKSLKWIIGLGLFILIGHTNVQAQTPDSLQIKMVAEATGDFVILRWIPMDYKTWKWGIENGYTLERITMEGPDGTLTNPERQASHVVLATNLRPLPESEWESLADTDELAGVAAGAIYGEGFLIEDLTSSDIVTAYNVNQEEENRYGFSLFAADQAFYIAESMGLGFQDQTTESGYKYVYRLSPIDPPANTVVKQGIIITSPDDVELLPQPVGLAANAGDQVVSLSWSKTDNFEKFTSFIIERSDDNGTSFNRINETPFVFMTPETIESENVFFADSLTANNQLYIYRVKGLSPFGIESPPSDTVHVIGKPSPIPARPSIQTIQEIETGKLTITWEFPDQFNSLIDGFDIYRSNRRNGVYTKINSVPNMPTNRTFVDDNPNIMNFYQIKGLDSNGYELESFAALGQILDETPPAPPTGVTGGAAPNGVVTLHWAANTDDDLMGYRVYVSNHNEGEFMQITTTWIKDTFFHHPINLNNLGEFIYFKVKAIDFRENYSAYSETIQVARPDIIPPSPPSVTQFEATMSGVKIHWLGSSSKDVVKHQLQRKRTDENSWAVLYDSDSDDFTKNYLDAEASFRYTYQYRVMAFDEVNLQASSRIMVAQPLDSGLRAEVENVYSQVEVIEINQDSPDGNITLATNTGQIVDRLNIAGVWNIISSTQPSLTDNETLQRVFGVVNLRWSYPEDAKEQGLHSFQIYRAKNGDPMRAYKTIYPNQSAIFSSDGLITYGMRDAEVRSNNVYTYQVMAKYIDGGYSPLSEETEINY